MPRTLRATSSNKLRPGLLKALPALRGKRAFGFSLIEVLIVIALVALMTAVGIPALNRVFRASNDSFARKIAVTLREARDRAMLNDKLLRLRIDFEKQQYWFEEAPASFLVAKKSDKDQWLTERQREEQAKKDAESFRMVKELAEDKISLPSGLKITEVINPRVKGKQTEGLADIYFYANGHTDGAKIHLESEEKSRMEITLHPVTGQSKMEMGYEDTP
jgi:prepilin-type N-terminal cleavage/methylation domain-containing protein